MSRLVHQMDQQSVNFYAEVLTKNLAIRGGRAGTTANGVRAIRNAIHDLGLSYKTARIYDGSGLSTGDRLSAAQILGLLRNVGPAGLERLLSRGAPARRRERHARGSHAARGRRTRNVLAKTGTLDDASALSGYLNAANGHRIIFSMIMNRADMNVLAAHKLQDRIAQLLAGSAAG